MPPSSDAGRGARVVGSEGAQPGSRHRREHEATSLMAPRGGAARPAALPKHHDSLDAGAGEQLVENADRVRTIHPVVDGGLKDRHPRVRTRVFQAEALQRLTLLITRRAGMSIERVDLPP